MARQLVRRATSTSLATSTIGARSALPVERSRPNGPPRSGGPEGKLRGRPPPLVEPRSGPWRRTGSESGAGRAQTRRCEYDERVHATTTRRESQIAASCCNFCKRRCAAAFVVGGRHVSASSRSEKVG